MQDSRRDLLFLALFFGALYFFMLGQPPLANPDAGRYAEIPREMMASGDWVTPRLNGVAYFEKPPLVYWAVAGWMSVFGLGETSARAVPALFGLGGVLLTYAAARRLYGRGAGLASAFVLGLSILHFALSRILILDMAVSVLMTGTLFCFILGVREAPGWRRRFLFYGLYASAALATLSKGLIGFLLTGAVMFLWLLVFNQWKRLRPLYLPSGAVLFLILALPWHLLAAARNPRWAQFYFIHEQWVRFTTTEHSRTGPWWYFVPILLLGLFPWAGFLWGAIRAALAGGWARRKENADAWFLAAWAIVIFVFFSKSQSKLPPYILPVFPPLAVLIGVWMDRKVREEDASFRKGIWIGVALCALLAVGALVAVRAPRVIRDPWAAAALRPYGAAVAGVLLAGAAATAWLLRKRGSFAGLVALGMSAAGLYVVLVPAIPLIQRPSTKELALKFTAIAHPGDRIYHYHEFFHDFTFYARRTVGVVAFQGELEPFNDDPARMRETFVDEPEFRRQWSSPTRIFAVARRGDVAELFADPGFHYHLLAETRGHYLFSNQP